MARRRKSTPHGPVRIITDPAELAKIAARIKNKDRPVGAVPCNGKTITVKIKDQEREVTDHYIYKLLEDDAAKDAKTRLNRKQRCALADFRYMLSSRGPAAFTDNQKEYLGVLIRIVENPHQRKELTPQERKVRNRQIKAFFAFLESQKEEEVCPREVVADFITPAILTPIITEVSKILRPYGMDSEAEAFVMRCCRAGMTIIAYLMKKETVIPREWRGYLTRKALNPESISYFADCRVFDISSIPERLGKELRGVPLEAAEIVKEKLNYLIYSAKSNFRVYGGSDALVSISALASGAPGSGKGGSPVK